MPIRDLSDRAGALPTIGELRKGGPKQEKNGREIFGQDLGDRFRFTSDDPRVTLAFEGIFGAEPTEVLCLLAGATTDDAFEAWCEEFGASELKHRCDGQQVVYRRNEDGTREDWPLGKGPPCPYLGLAGKERPRDACKPHGRLKLIPVEVDRSGRVRIANLRRIGQVLALTTSKHDIKNIAECLRLYESLHGSLMGVPFVLGRTPASITTPRPDGTRVRTNKWLLDLRPSPEWVSLQLESARQRAFMAIPGAIAALPAAVIETQGDDEAECDEPQPYGNHWAIEPAGSLEQIEEEFFGDDDRPRPNGHTKPPEQPYQRAPHVEATAREIDEILAQPPAGADAADTDEPDTDAAFDALGSATDADGVLRSAEHQAALAEVAGLLAACKEAGINQAPPHPQATEMAVTSWIAATKRRLNAQQRAAARGAR